MESLAARALTSVAESENWLSEDYHAQCVADPSPQVSLEAMRRLLSKIPGNIATDFRTERDE